MIATIVDVDALWQTIWTAALAGVGVTVVYACAVLGSTRAMEASRERRTPASAAYAALALLSTAGVIAAIVYAFVLITTK